MVVINCDSPSTFVCFEKDMCINDNSLNTFFFHPNKEQLITFNLPKGIYYTNNKVHKKQNFEPYCDFDYDYDFLNDKIKHFEIEKAFNPHKASINFVMKKIIMDDKYYDHDYKPIKTFLTLHEIGHLINPRDIFSKGKKIFDCEKFCDDFAVNYMLANGWNPTQIDIAAKMLLKNEERKNCVSNNTINKKIRK